MGFFKDFKEDFNDAVSELVPGGDDTKAEEVMVNTLDGDIDVESELTKLDGLLEQVSKKVDSPASPTVSVARPAEPEKKSRTMSAQSCEVNLLQPRTSWNAIENGAEMPSPKLKPYKK